MKILDAQIAHIPAIGLTIKLNTQMDDLAIVSGVTPMLARRVLIYGGGKARRCPSCGNRFECDNCYEVCLDDAAMTTALAARP